MKKMVSSYAVLTLLACLIVLSANAAVLALHSHEVGGMGTQHTGDFRPSTAQSFAALMDEAMAIMHQGMDQAPKTGNPDHDFATMMIPHHQGAVDMAKVELVYGKDPVLRRLAQEIIVTQGQEIKVMRMRFKQDHAP